MTYCPFRRPESNTVSIGGVELDLLTFIQHEGFVYQQSRQAAQGTPQWTEWPRNTFSSILYLSSGALQIQAPDRGVETASTGEWVFLSALDQPLRIRIDAGTRLHWIECERSIWLALQQDHLHGESEHDHHACVTCRKRNEALVFRGKQGQKMRLQLSELERLKGNQAIERLRIASLSYELLSTTLDTPEFGQKPAADPCFRDCDSESLKAAAHYLEENLGSEHSLRDLSRQFHLNEFKLKKGFKAQYQTTVFGYLRLKRMEHAKSMLLHSDASVLEIATHVGYSNPSHFARAFRETFGVNPGTLRRDV